MRLRPLVEQVAGYQCRVAVLEVMNEAIEEELEKAQWGTKELVTTKYNPDGSIAALEMDAIALNRLKAELTQAISNELLAMGEQRVDIPLGTIGQVPQVYAVAQGENTTQPESSEPAE